VGAGRRSGDHSVLADALFRAAAFSRCTVLNLDVYAAAGATGAGDFGEGL